MIFPHIVLVDIEDPVFACFYDARSGDEATLGPFVVIKAAGQPGLSSVSGPVHTVTRGHENGVRNTGAAGRITVSHHAVILETHGNGVQNMLCTGHGAGGIGVKLISRAVLVGVFNRLAPVDKVSGNAVLNAA